MELDGLPSTVMPAPVVTLTFDLITMFQAQVHFSENYLRSYCIHPAFTSLPAVTVTSDL